MPPTSRTSFIPKKPMEARTRRRSLSVFASISSLLFILSLVGSGGVFAYNKFVESSIERKRANLEKARAAFEPSLIEELARLDRRLVLSGDILDRHLSVGGFFNVLEDLTVQNVRFNKFSFETGDEGILLTMGGEARSFNAVAVQSGVFVEGGVVQNGLFSGLNLDQVGNAKFDFSATLDPSQLRYKAKGVLPKVPTQATTSEPLPSSDPGASSTATGTATSS